MSEKIHHLFDVYGIELEYMIADRQTLSVKPVADRVLEAEAGKIVSDVEFGDMAWSNELVLHVIELKVNGPVKTLDSDLATRFQAHVLKINRILESFNARLMPSAAHPWMNPATETRLWPHEFSPIYGAYDRIFGCGGHGWSNLQSTHINLPFAGDAEFAGLHAAIRLLMPIMPALTASSPVLDGRFTGFLDARMEVYRHNADMIPSIAGKIIPEPVFDEATYRKEIFQRTYQDIAPHDPEGILQHEFLNSRGAIARFDRGAIEIRILDIQECPLADIAAAWLITSVLKSLVNEKWHTLEHQKQKAVDPLAAIFLDVIRDADKAVIRDQDYLDVFGIRGQKEITAGEVWQHLFACVGGVELCDAAIEKALGVILRKGCLARRILAAAKNDFSHARLKAVYADLCHCLENNVLFDP